MNPGAGYASKENVIKEAKHAKELLHTDVDVFYVHAPDADTPMEHTLEGVNEVYKKGFFKRFGLSNYKAEDVEKVYNHCKEKGYPLPSVYQGMGPFVGCACGCNFETDDLKETTHPLLACKKTYFFRP